MRKFYFLFLIVVLCTASFTLLTCGDDDDDDDSGGTVDDDTTDDDTSSDDDVVLDDDVTDDDTTDDDTSDDDTSDDDTGDDDTSPPPTEPISVRLSDFITGNPVKNATCELVHNSNGSPFNPAITTTSDNDGYCLFNQGVKEDLFSMKVTVNGYVESYFFNYPSDLDWGFYMVSNVTRTLIFVLLGLDYDDDKGAVVGGVKWRPTTGNTQDIGCAEVTSSGGDAVYYMDDTGLPTTSRDSTNPNDGYFLSLLMDPGEYTFTADVEGDEESAAAPRVFAGALTYINIYFTEAEYPTNPTPAGCVK